MASVDPINPPKSPLVGEHLAKKVMSYSLVANLVQRTMHYYDMAKESNGMIKSALETGENLANKTISATQPILATVDKYGKIEERSLNMLNSIEEKSAGAVATIKALDKKRTELQTNIVSSVTTSVATRLEPIVARVESYLPIVEEIDLDNVDASAENDADAITEVAPVAPVQRIQSVSSRIGRVAKKRLQGLRQLSRDNFIGLRYAVDLIEFARNHADVKNLHITEVGDKVVARVHDAKELVVESYHKSLGVVVNKLEQSELIQKFEAAVGPHLTQIKDQSSRALLVILSAVGASVDFIHKELRLVANNDWNAAIQNATDNARSVIATLDQVTAGRIVQLTNALTAAYAKLSAERARLTAGTLNYLASFRVLIAVQSQLRDALVRVGINPNTLNGVLLSSKKQL